MRAQGEAPVELHLGGYFKGYAALTEQDSLPGTDVRDFDLLRVTEIHFDGKSELDNGLTVGAHIEIGADIGESSEIDESYVYFSGGWGRINLGARDGAAFILQVAAPAADRDVDGVRQQVQPVNFTAAGIVAGETDYDQNISAKADKVTYITPDFGGLQAGFSYTPEVAPSRGGNGDDFDNDGTTANNDVLDLAVRYEHDFEILKLTTGAGYSQAERELTPLAGTDDHRNAWNAGLNIGFGNFAVGGSYQHDDEGSNTGDVVYKVLGAAYKHNDILIGVSYYSKDNEITDLDIDRYTAGVTYTYAPGMEFRGSISRLTAEANDAENLNATSGLLATIISF